MRNKFSASTLAFLAPLAFAMAGSGAQAASLDGTQNLICSAIDTVHCVGRETCVQGRAQDVNIPQFFRLDFQEMTIRRQFGEGTERTSKIDSLRNDGGELILQGIEEGLGWSLLIDESSGRLTITASSDDEAFVVFGVCTTD
jgi:hypothetical protein